MSSAGISKCQHASVILVLIHMWLTAKLRHLFACKSKHLNLYGLRVLDHLLELILRSDCNRFTFVHYDYPVTDLLDLLHIMRCVHDGRALLIQTFYPLKYSVAALWIDCNCRFIEKYKLWLMRYSAGYIQSSEKSARKFFRQELSVVRYIHKIHGLLNALSSLLLILYIQTTEVIYILIHCQFVEHSHILHYNSDLPLDIIAVWFHLFSKYFYVSLVKCEQGQYTVYRCRLAGSIRSEKPQYLPFLHRQAEMIQRQQIFVSLYQIGNFYCIT